MSNTPQTLSIPVEVLALQDVEVIKVELDREKQFIITVASTKKEIPCHQFGICCTLELESAATLQWNMQ